ncbi:MAG: hypothetical protein IJO46_09545 [Thermoguttaceae bacterium]|nr:hypothetical protein [Thermoguttaceae bacterium]
MKRLALGPSFFFDVRSVYRRPRRNLLPLNRKPRRQPFLRFDAQLATLNGSRSNSCGEPSLQQYAETPP